MVHRAGIFVPDNAFFLFKNGLINGVTWNGHTTGYASYDIDDRLHARAYIWSGVTSSDSNASIVTQHLDLRGYKHVHFKYTGIDYENGEAPNIRVYPNYVSLEHEGEGPWTVSYDLSALADQSDVMLMIQSGHLAKTTSSGSIDASITVREVWVTRD